MKKPQIWLMILSILVGGFLFVSFYLDIPVLRSLGTQTLIWAERLFAALLFFAIVEALILQVRKNGNDFSTRLVRTIGFAVLLAVLILGLVKGPEAEDFNNTVFFVQKTLESALAGMVCLSLIFAMYRLPGQAPTVIKTAFFIGLIFFALIYSGIIHLSETPELLNNIIEWLKSVPRGGMMGLLLGIALGGAVTGLRFIVSGKIPAKEDK